MKFLLEAEQAYSGANVISNVPGKRNGVKFLKTRTFEISDNNVRFRFSGRFNYPFWQYGEEDDGFNGGANWMELARNDAEGIFFRKNYSGIPCIVCLAMKVI